MNPIKKNKNPVDILKASFTLNFQSQEWVSLAPKLLKKYGVLVINNVFSEKECTELMTEMINQVSTICPELKQKGKWTDAYTPPGPRSGLYQNTVGHIPVVWKVRTDERIREIFTVLYSGIREKKIKDFVTSCDGINLRPYGKPFRTNVTKDWAHLDQTTTKKHPTNAYMCVQGQVVLSDSDACFCCSPLSTHKFTEISKLTKSNFVKYSKTTNKELKPTNWNILKPNQYEPVKSLIEQIGGTWQMPIQESRGSMIFWFSSTIHSARIQAEHPRPQPSISNPWNGWRGVIYVCYRPKEDVDGKHFKRLQKCINENRCTNHWGAKMFPTSYFRKKFSPRITEYLQNPLKVYEDYPELKPKWTEKLQALCFPNPYNQ